MLQSILLFIIPRFRLLIEMFICFSQIFDRSNTARIVSGDRWTAEALTEDAVAGAEAEGVVGLGEDAALDLGREWRVRIRSNGDASGVRYLEKIEETRSRD